MSETGRRWMVVPGGDVVTDVQLYDMKCSILCVDVHEVLGIVTEFHLQHIVYSQL